MPRMSVALSFAGCIVLACTHPARESAARAPQAPPTTVASAAPALVAPESLPAASPAPPPDLFARTVAPLLAQRCTPCHVPGGKMYDRMPFDDAKTVASHKDGVLRRMKTPEDRAVVETWLASIEGRP